MWWPPVDVLDALDVLDVLDVAVELGLDVVGLDAFLRGLALLQELPLLQRSSICLKKAKRPSVLSTT